MLKYLTLEKVTAIAEILGIEYNSIIQIPNAYWQGDDSIRGPWFKIDTVKYGSIIIGWRKRVIQISWEDTKYRIDVHNSNIVHPGSGDTLCPYCVHAWNEIDAILYLKRVIEYMDNYVGRIKAVSKEGNEYHFDTFEEYIEFLTVVKTLFGESIQFTIVGAE